MRTNYGTVYLKKLFLLVTSVTLLHANHVALGDTIFTEDWETPVIATAPVEILPGFFVPTDTRLPAGWNSGRNLPWILAQPATSRFSNSLPFSAPAGEDQALILEGSNTGVSFETVVISANTQYTLSAAIGSSLDTSENNMSWSLQLWADTSGDGTVTDDDVFLGQSFGTQSGVTTPARGEWALNSVSINSNDAPEAIGRSLLVFLNNFNVSGGGTSYYDNVSLSSATSVPEPNAGLIVSLVSVCR